MTRFARADGSKSCNKKSHQDATPWDEMIKHNKNTHKELQNKTIKNEVDNTEIKKLKTKKSKVINGDDDDVQSNDNMKVKIKNKISKDYAVQDNSDINEAKPKIKNKVKNDTVVHNDVGEIKKLKVKKQKNKNEDDEVHRNNIGGKKNKICKDKGKENNNDDTEETSDIKNKTEDNKVLDSKVCNIKENSKKKVQKDNADKQKKKPDFIIENGFKYKVFKNGEKKPWFDLQYEENEIMTRYNKFFVKREMVQVLDDYKTSLEKEGLDKRQIANNMLTKERKAHNTLRLELLRGKIRKSKDLDDGKLAGSLRRKFKREKQKLCDPTLANYCDKQGENKQVAATNGKFGGNNQKSNSHPAFEENDVMTCFEGYWVLRENVQHLQTVYDMKVKRIIQAREDGNASTDLTPEETQQLGRLMKKEKRREMKKLKQHLHKGKYGCHGEKSRKPGKYLGINYQSGKDMVKYDGFWIKKDAVERLDKLRETLRAKGCSEEEIQKIMKNERRKEERMLKHENRLFCYKCRKNGHMITSCPEVSDNERRVDICFKCGSTEHMARNCPENRRSDSGSFSYATCFICGEGGHIARQCPDNPKGLYPHGGSCNECGSVEHLKKDCPELQIKNESTEMKLTRYNSKRNFGSVEQEDEPEDAGPEPTVAKPKKKKAKTIVF